MYIKHLLRIDKFVADKYQVAGIERKWRIPGNLGPPGISRRGSYLLYQRRSR